MLFSCSANVQKNNLFPVHELLYGTEFGFTCTLEIFYSLPNSVTNQKPKNEFKPQLTHNLATIFVLTRILYPGAKKGYSLPSVGCLEQIASHFEAQKK